MTKKILNIIGVVLIVIGVILVIASVFGASQTMIVDTPFGSIKADGITTISETMIMAGAVLILLGLLAIYISSKMRR